MFKIFHKVKRGFTLIELVMVIVIISVLAAIIIPKFVGQRAQAEIAETKANLQTLRTAVELYKANDAGEDGKYPANLAALVTAGYIRKEPKPSVKNKGGTPATGWDYTQETGNVKVNISGEDVNGDEISEY